MTTEKRSYNDVTYLHNTLFGFMLAKNLSPPPKKKESLKSQKLSFLFASFFKKRKREGWLSWIDIKNIIFEIIQKIFRQLQNVPLFSK